jgi:hypothetical protein
MEFCIISPTAGLERYATLSKTHLVLAHECKNHDYVEFYIKRQQEGDFIILDNGAYESGRPTYDWNVIGALEPDVIVLPDYPLQPWKKTWHASMTWLDENFDDASGFEVCYIPQAEKGDLHGFLESYQEAVADPRIGWLGIPRALSYAITDNPLMRVEFARMVKRDHPNIKLHAFGMVNGDVHEIPYLAQAGVNSIDSSAPIWRGWNANKVDDRFDRNLWDREGTAVNFSSAEPIDGWDQVAHDCIRHNLEACGIPTRK